MREDRIIGAAVAVLGAGMFVYSLNIAAPFAGSGDPGPALVPRVLGLLLAGLGLILALRRPKAVAVSAEPDLPKGAQVLRVEAPTRPRQILLGVAFVGFILLFNILGFTLSALLFLASAMALLGPATPAFWIRAGAIALAVVLIVGYLLNGLLGLTIPGVWIG